jgi:hypothetical protein
LSFIQAVVGDARLGSTVIRRQRTIYDADGLALSASFSWFVPNLGYGAEAGRTGGGHRAGLAIRTTASITSASPGSTTPKPAVAIYRVGVAVAVAEDSG